MPERMLSLTQVADQIGVNELTVRRWIADGRLPAHRLGPRLIRVAASDLETLLTASRFTAA